MKTVTSKDDAIEKAYYLGMLSQYGNLKIEGIGNRKTNWGIGTTFICRGLPRYLAQEALSWIIDIEQTFRNNKDLSIPLTTLAETESFSQKLGVLSIYKDIVELVREYDEQNDMKAKRLEGGGRVEDDTPVQLDCPLKDYETDIAVAVIDELEKWASYDAIAQAFTLGKRGLTLRQEEIAKIVEIVEIVEIAA